MKRFVEAVDRSQGTLFPECLEDWISADNPVRAIDVLVDELDLDDLGFDRVEPRATGRPGDHPCVLLKLYIYGYPNRAHVFTQPGSRRCLCGATENGYLAVFFVHHGIPGRRPSARGH